MDIFKVAIADGNCFKQDINIHPILEFPEQIKIYYYIEGANVPKRRLFDYLESIGAEYPNYYKLYDSQL